MPLIKSTLKTGIENALKNEFKKDAVKKSLRKYLDGGASVGAKTNSKSISTALGNISKASMVVKFGTADNLASQVVAGDLIKRVTANEWANAISDSVSEWMSSDIAPILAQVISDEVDKYLKTADVKVTIPPGLVSQGAGPAAIPNAAPLPITGMPNNPLLQGGLT
jgi:phage I-like protein